VISHDRWVCVWGMCFVCHGLTCGVSSGWWRGPLKTCRTLDSTDDSKRDLNDTTSRAFKKAHTHIPHVSTKVINSPHSTSQRAWLHKCCARGGRGVVTSMKSVCAYLSVTTLYWYWPPSMGPRSMIQYWPTQHSTAQSTDRERGSVQSRAGPYVASRRCVLSTPVE
jgi:hypothetical protein